MKVLFLGPTSSPLRQWLVDQGEYVVGTAAPITPGFVVCNNFDFLISYGYRYILSKDILDLLPNRAVNLHIALLPWNRGADPNLWSFIEDTPKGVTIHYLDEGIDTGDIIVQREMVFEAPGETLATPYQKLQSEIQGLFKKFWFLIKTGTCPRTKQVGCGSFHRSRDKAAITLLEGWDTSIGYYHS